MIGIDITSIIRFENKGEKFAKKILSKQEFNLWKSEEFRAGFLATRWAIKEAIFKCNNDFYCFNEINLDKINGKYIFKNFQISTSKENNYVIAIAIEKKED